MPCSQAVFRRINHLATSTVGVGSADQISGYHHVTNHLLKCYSILTAIATENCGSSCSDVTSISQNVGSSNDQVINEMNEWSEKMHESRLRMLHLYFHRRSQTIPPPHKQPGNETMEGKHISELANGAYMHSLFPSLPHPPSPPLKPARGSIAGGP